jgi:hypothetical protein
LVGGKALVEDYERSSRVVRTMLIDLEKPGSEAKVLFNRNEKDAYKNPGTPVGKSGARGRRQVIQAGDEILLSGPGSSPTGDHPFLDKFNVATGKTERVYQSGADAYGKQRHAWALHQKLYCKELSGGRGTPLSPGGWLVAGCWRLTSSNELGQPITHGIETLLCGWFAAACSFTLCAQIFSFLDYFQHVFKGNHGVHNRPDRTTFKIGARQWQKKTSRS